LIFDAVTGEENVAPFLRPMHGVVGAS